jgi:hypothetical protein
MIVANFHQALPSQTVLPRDGSGRSVPFVNLENVKNVSG